MQISRSTRRERQHIEVIRLVLSGERDRAAVLGREHLREFPDDILSLSSDVTWTRLRRGRRAAARTAASPSSAIATPRRSALSTARTRLVVSSSIAAAGSPSVVAISPRHASDNTAPSTDPVASKRANASRWYEVGRGEVAGQPCGFAHAAERLSDRAGELVVTCPAQTSFVPHCRLVESALQGGEVAEPGCQHRCVERVRPGERHRVVRRRVAEFASS